ncbi:MAG: translation initiation factor [Fuerstiella sp.]
MTRLFAGTKFDRPPHCERCGEPEQECRCPPVPPAAAERVPPEKQTARLAVEKRKRGKTVTVIRGLATDANDLPSLLTQLKNKCGAGGSLHDDHLEIQGDHLSRLRNELQKIGYKVKG